MSHPNNHLTFVVYDEQKPALCYQISKKALRWLSILAPLIVILLFTIFSLFMLLGPFWQELSGELSSQRKSEELLKQQYLQLDQANKRLQERYELLQKKWVDSKKTKPTLLSPQNDSSGSYEHLSASSSPIWPEHLKILDASFIQGAQEWILTFNFQNTMEQKKISGHFFVLMDFKKQITGYPQHPFQWNNQAFKLFPNKGEPFLVARFRPVKAIFTPLSLKVDPKQLAFFVLIFDKNGTYLGKYPIKVPSSESRPPL
jgi:hypothetical protein